MGFLNGFRGAKRRKLILEVRVTELHHAFGPRQVAQRMCSQVGQKGTLGQPVEDKIAGDTRQHRLPAVGQIS